MPYTPTTTDEKIRDLQNTAMLEFMPRQRRLEQAAADMRESEEEFRRLRLLQYELLITHLAPAAEARAQPAVSDVQAPSTPPVITLGDRVCDRFTGLTGWVHGIAHYITGCDQILLHPRKLSDDGGKIVDGVWLDDSRLELLEAQPTPPSHNRGGPTAGEASGLRIS